MFLGHFGLGFAGKRVAPELRLGTLFLAVQWADFLFWILALFGVEHFRSAPGAKRSTPMDFYDYPWSRGLVAFPGAAWIGSVVGSPPPDERTVEIAAAVAMWLLVSWGYGIDRHRTVALA
jgi:hypothetical protein